MRDRLKGITRNSLIAELERRVADSKEAKQGADDASWGYEEGILLTRREAQAILRLIRPKPVASPRAGGPSQGGQADG